MDSSSLSFNVEWHGDFNLQCELMYGWVMFAPWICRSWGLGMGEIIRISFCKVRIVGYKKVYLAAHIRCLIGF